MTTIPTALRLARIGFTVVLLGAGLTIGSLHAGGQSGAAVLNVAAPVSTLVSPAQQASQSDAGIDSAAVKPARATLPPAGAAGFGWG
jgi:hypothetical protein